MTAYNEHKQVADLTLFAAVVESGGISACARLSGLERTTISRRIKRLAQSIGVDLFDRERHKVTLTAEGQRCYEHASKLLPLARHALRVVNGNNHREERRPVRIGVPNFALDFVAKEVLGGCFDSATQLPAIDVVPVVTPTPGTLRGVDLAFFVGAPEDRAVPTIEIGRIPYVLCCSPTFLRYAGSMTELSALRQHPWLVDARQPNGHRWTLRCAGRTHRIAGSRVVETMGQLESREAAIAGAGIARLPWFLCEHAFAAGLLLPILPEVEVPPEPLILAASPASDKMASVTEVRLRILDRARRPRLAVVGT